jgi:hypothetical protein
MYALDFLGCAYRVDRDREIRAGWGHARFMFRITGNDNSFFSVQGYWDTYLDGDRRADTLEYASTWNNEHFMPQAEVVSYDDEDQQFVTDHAVDYSYGLTDEQLCRHIEMGMYPAERFFGEVGEMFPDSVRL